MIIPKEEIDNDYTLNIFSDASISSQHTYTNACAGAIAVYQDFIIDKILTPMYNTTNNRAELMAILNGLYLAIRYRRKVKRINIFSDSKISVFGLRTWIYSWINNSQDNILRSTSGDVKNQDMILSIINFIIENNLQISLFHIRGHCDYTKFKDIIKFRKSFISENNLYPNIIDDQLCMYLIKYNDYIDNDTRKNLINDKIESLKPYTLNLNSYLPYLDMDKYKLLLGGK